MTITDLSQNIPGGKSAQAPESNPGVAAILKITKLLNNRKKKKRKNLHTEIMTDSAPILVRH